MFQSPSNQVHQQRQRQQAIYVNHQQQAGAQQNDGCMVQPAGATAPCNGMQLPVSIGAQNIEIFPVEDEYHQHLHQQQQHHSHSIGPPSIPTTVSQGAALTNGHFQQNVCSSSSSNSNSNLEPINSVATAARGAGSMSTRTTSLSVPQTSSASHMMPPHSTSSQRLVPPPPPPLMSSSSSHLGTTTIATTPLMTISNNNDNYLLEPNTEWYNSENGCSLPVVHQPIQPVAGIIGRHDQRRQTPRISSWQQVPVSGATTNGGPESLAQQPKPAFGGRNSARTSSYNEHQHQHQAINSKDLCSSLRHQQHSPAQSLHQNYYQPVQAPVNRANEITSIILQPTAGKAAQTPSAQLQATHATAVGQAGDQLIVVANDSSHTSSR